MARLPPIARIDGTSAGTGFFLCGRKERRTGRSGVFLVLLLQDVTGELDAKVFHDVETASQQFEVGEFVAVQGKGNVFNNRLELVIERIRRVIPEDRQAGFREEDCIPCSSRPLEEMWQELELHVGSVADPHIRGLLTRVMDLHGDRLKIWPAGRQVHHAYRSGLLEHVLQIMQVSTLVAEQYGLRRDLLIAGALLHDIGKLQELSYETAISYSVEGNLVGHIVIGAGMLRDVLRGLPEFPPDLALEIEHLILSHHGTKALGSPVTPMTAEALVLSAIDDLDAKLHQVKRHLADDNSPGPFTTYHRYLERVLLKSKG
jgi:3'-5' exoribonuclease